MDQAVRIWRVNLCIMRQTKDVPKGGDGRDAPPPWRMWGPRGPQAREGTTTALALRAAGRGAKARGSPLPLRPKNGF